MFYLLQEGLRLGKPQHTFQKAVEIQYTSLVPTALAWFLPIKLTTNSPSQHVDLVLETLNGAMPQGS